MLCKWGTVIECTKTKLWQLLLISKCCSLFPTVLAVWHLIMKMKLTLLLITSCLWWLSHLISRNTGIWTRIIYNYPPKGRWIVVDIYRDAKRQGIYPPLFTDPEGDSCFSIYQIRWIKKCHFINGHNFFFWNFHETMCHFPLRSQNSEYPRIFHVTGANQNTQKLLSTYLVNTNYYYYCHLI